MQERQGPPQPVRAHARRNREKLLAAALDEFNRAGNDASLGAIARAAGVGIATLYRHFPNRESLVLATYEYEVDQLCAAADNLLETVPPDQALREWMRGLAALLVTKQHMSEAMQSMSYSGAGWASESYAKVFGAIDSLFAAGVAAKTIRGDLETADVVLAMSGLLRLDVAGDWRSQADRLIGLLMDGLRAGTGSPGR